ncbi:putative ATPase [Paraburkholderia sp. CI3]
MTVTERPANYGTSMIDLGRFQIDLEMRTLHQSGTLVPVGSRAFDILAVLVSAAGRLVTKDELLDSVWPKTVVEENNIQVHLSALRKILGEDRNLIVTIPGRGYQLRQRPVESRAPAVESRAFRRSLPLRETRLTGRDAAVRQISMLLQTTQLLTLTGAGGIGKTSLAIEVARQASNDSSRAVCFVELATATTEDAVLCEVAEACGLSTLDAAVDIAQLAAAVSGKRLLLVLDNAEHVIDAVARIVDALVAASEILRVMVTSREPLRLMQETVYRVEPLDVPSSHSTHAEIVQFPAVKLFLLRVNSIQRYAYAGCEKIHLIGEICRRLDGIPLAIELAAARVAGLGVEGVHRYLHDRFSLLTGGYRTALPRHQTFRATFDWSFSILNPCHQLLFRRLAVFSGGFTFDAMCAVVCDEKYAVADAIGGIGDLVAKSLVNIELEGPVSRYRLSDSARAYALEKLHAEGEQKLIAARHARYVSHCLRPCLADSVAEQLDLEIDFRQSLDDARSAFDWAFSQHGDTRIGVELAAGLTEALLDAGLIHECCTRAEQAIDALEELPPASVDSDTEMRVRATLASALIYAPEPVSKSAQSWTEVLALAGDTGEGSGANSEGESVKVLPPDPISSSDNEQAQEYGRTVLRPPLQPRRSFCACAGICATSSACVILSR